jgi:hypothetical protein
MWNGFFKINRGWCAISPIFNNKKVIYQKFNSLPEFLNEDALFSFDGNGGVPLGDVFYNIEIKRYMVNGPYIKNEPRLANVYKNPGIIKYQKNWGGRKCTHPRLESELVNYF